MNALAHLLSIATLAVALPPGSAREPAPSAIKTHWGPNIVNQKPEWYASTEARAIAENVLRYQTDAGAWAKNTDLAATPKSGEKLNAARTDRRVNTIDNGAATVPMQFLALMMEATHDARYSAAVDRALNYLLSAQYPNGGWPQFYPLRDHGYYSLITFNDDAMVNVLTILGVIAEGKPPFTFVDPDQRTKAATAHARGVKCVLRTQIKQDGRLTAWCAQYDEKTLEPAWARAYEPPSLSGAESVGITRFLMGLENPTPELIAAVEGAAAWLKSVAIEGCRLESFTNAEGRRDRRIVADPTAKPIWARFYEIGTNRPIFTSQRGRISYAISDIAYEKRNSYAFYGQWPAELLATDYPAWRARHRLP